MSKITLDTLLKDIVWLPHKSNTVESMLFYSKDFLTEDPSKVGELGSITILDRLTGYSGYVRDIETGYKDKNGRFWLASEYFDIRKHKDIATLTVGQAIEIIKREANLNKGE